MRLQFFTFRHFPNALFLMMLNKYYKQHAKYQASKKLPHISLAWALFVLWLSHIARYAPSPA